MSLINDALKRASQADRDRARKPQTHVRMEPAAERPGRSLSVVLGLAIVIVLGLAGWFFGQWWHAGHLAAPPVVQTVTAVAPKPAPAPAPPPMLREALPPSPAQVAAPTPAPTPIPAPEPALAPPAKPVVQAWPANLKLMGIFFSKTNPRALINGKTVAVGDEIEGIKVTKIEHDQVTVEWNGQVKQLVIE